MFKQDQEIFNILLETISQGVIIVDNQQVIMEINKSAGKLFGYSKKELIGKSLNTLIPKEYHLNHISHFKDFVKEGKRREMGEETMDIFGAHSKGKKFPVKIDLSPFNIYNKST